MKGFEDSRDESDVELGENRCSNRLAAFVVVPFLKESALANLGCPHDVPAYRSCVVLDNLSRCRQQVKLHWCRHGSWRKISRVGCYATRQSAMSFSGARGTLSIISAVANDLLDLGSDPGLPLPPARGVILLRA